MALDFEYERSIEIRNRINTFLWRITSISAIQKNRYIAILHVFNEKLIMTFFNIFQDELIDRKKAFGRIAFAVPYAVQTEINQFINDNKQTILTPLITLATPGKATVRVIILSDPNDLEICFVDEEGFSELSQVDEQSEAELDKYIKKDPFQSA